MTVLQLIAKLLEYPHNLIVSTAGYEGGFKDSVSVVLKEVALNYYDQNDMGEHEDLEEVTPTKVGEKSRRVVIF